MASSIQLLRSTKAQERPFPNNLLEGQPALNLNSTEPGLFFKATDGSLVKVGPAAITADGSPPNASATGLTGNTVGEMWLDKSLPIPVLKVYDGVQWVDAGSGSGGSPGVVTLQRWVKTASGGETSVSGLDNSAQILSYTPGLEEVFLNGVLLTRGVDYIADSGISIASLAPLTNGDEVTVLGWTPFNIIGAIDGSNLIDGTVSQAKLSDASVTDIKVASNAAISSSKLQFLQSGAGAVSQSVKDRLEKEVLITDFGAVPNDPSFDSTAAIQAAVDYAMSVNATLIWPQGSYYITDSIRVFRGGTMRWRATGCRLAPKSDGFIIDGINFKFGSSPPVDTTYPVLPLTDDSYLGPVRGAAIVFGTLKYYTQIEGLRLEGFRFGLVWLTPHNSPEIKECWWNYCNVGIWCYQGSQNYRILGCSTGTLSVFWISSATATPSDSPFTGQDNSYTDGLTVEQRTGGAFGTMPISDSFDDWYIDSVLRPNVDSVWAGGTEKYKNSSGVVYPNSSKYCRPSGRIFFIPFRNSRTCFGFYSANIDQRGPCYRGFALINSTVVDFTVLYIRPEFSFGIGEPDPDQPFFEIGGAYSGQVSGGVAVASGGAEQGHPLVGFTDKEAVGLRKPLVSVDVTDYPDGEAKLGVYNQNLWTESGFFNYSPLTGLAEQYDSRPDGGAVSYSGSELGSGRATSNNGRTTNFISFAPIAKTLLLDGNPLVFNLPQKSSSGLTWHADLSFAGEPNLAGLLKVDVLNLAEGSWDYGEFAYQNINLSLTVSVDINNGDEFIQLQAAPSPVPNRFARVELTSGVFASVDYYDNANLRLYVIGGVGGLSSPIPSGSSITFSRFCTAIQPFRRDWITLGFGIVPYSSGFGIRNNIADQADEADNGVLHIILRGSHLAGQDENYFSSPPSGGRWARGAIVYNTNPTAGGDVGWICVSGGTPGTWKSFGAISA